MSKQINIIAGEAVIGAAGTMTSAGNPWTVSDGLADELVNRRKATYVTGQPVPSQYGVAQWADSSGTQLIKPDGSSVSLGTGSGGELEYTNLAAFPATGATGFIYVALDTNRTYRWSGSVYVEISPTDTSAALTGLSTASSVDLSASDTILSALGKLQGKWNAIAATVRGAVVSAVDITTRALVSTADTVEQAIGHLQAQISQWLGAATNVASAATTNIGAAATPYVIITGTTGITAFDNVAAGITRFVRFAGALTLTHNAATLILPNGENVTTVAGDRAVFVSEGSGNWRCLSYNPAISSFTFGLLNNGTASAWRTALGINGLIGYCTYAQSITPIAATAYAAETVVATFDLSGKIGTRGWFEINLHWADNATTNSHTLRIKKTNTAGTLYNQVNNNSSSNIDHYGHFEAWMKDATTLNFANQAAESPSSDSAVNIATDTVDPNNFIVVVTMNTPTGGDTMQLNACVCKVFNPDAVPSVNTSQISDVTALARVAVANVFTKGQAVTPVVLTDAATVAVDASLSNNFRLTLGGNRTLANPTNLVDGQVLNFRFKQDATGSRTLAYDTKYKFPSGAAAVLSTGANKVDRLSGVYIAVDDVIECGPLLQDIR